jgi:hypothetical protein
MREGRRSTYKRGLCGKGFCVEILKVGWACGCDWEEIIQHRPGWTPRAGPPCSAQHLVNQLWEKLSKMWLKESALTIHLYALTMCAYLYKIESYLLLCILCLFSPQTFSSITENSSNKVCLFIYLEVEIEPKWTIESCAK